MSRSSVVSLPSVILSSRPKAVVEDALIKLLTKQLKELDIIWNASVFRKALRNPKLPAHLLEKLEELIAIAEASNWRVSSSFTMELDETVEDIESYNPKFIAYLRQLKKRSVGKTYTIEEIKRRYL